MPYFSAPDFAEACPNGPSGPLSVSPLKVLLHDIKNPLAHIQSTTELLRHELEALPQPAGDFEQYLEILELSARRAALLVQRVQLLAQPMPGRLQAQPLHRIAQETARLYRIWAQQRGLKLELCLEPVWVMADEGFLAQIVDNLLSNALKHSDRDGRVEIQVTRGEGHGLLRVHDQGPGIPEAQLARLFEPREQHGHAGAPPQGLGLAISRQLCELMQGTIVYEPGSQGAGFCVSLPLADIF